MSTRTGDVREAPELSSSPPSSAAKLSRNSTGGIAEDSRLHPVSSPSSFAPASSTSTSTPSSSTRAPPGFGGVVSPERRPQDAPLSPKGPVPSQPSRTIQGLASPRDGDSHLSPRGSGPVPSQPSKTFLRSVASPPREPGAPVPSVPSKTIRGITSPNRDGDAAARSKSPPVPSQPSKTALRSLSPSEAPSLLDYVNRPKSPPVPSQPSRTYLASTSPPSTSSIPEAGKTFSPTRGRVGYDQRKPQDATSPPRDSARPTSPTMGPPPGFPTRSLSPTNVAGASSPLSPGRSRDENNAEVQYQIGLSLMYGTGHTDPQKALAWFRKAAEQKHILAMYHLGHGLWKSPGVQHDLPLAREWLTRAANLNCTFAQNSLAQLLARSEKSDERQQALRWFEKAAEAGLPEAKANLGTMYAVGFLVQKDEARALGLTKQAAEGGLSSAMHQLGSWYEKGIGAAKDLEEAARWYQRAARAGNAQAQDALERLQSGCAVCGQKTEKRCLACGVVRYCGPEHQKVDWPTHKHICRKVPSGGSGSAIGVSPAAAAGLTSSSNALSGSPSGSTVSSASASSTGPSLVGSGTSPLPPTTEGSASAVQAH